MEIKQENVSRFRFELGKFLRDVRAGEVGYVFTHYSEKQIALIPYKELIRLQNIEEQYLKMKEDSHE